MTAFPVDLSKGSVVLRQFNAPQFELSCFGFQFAPPRGTTCSVPPSGQVTMTITDPAASNTSSAITVDLSALYSGSLTASMFAFASTRTFVITAKLSQATLNSKCAVTVYASSFDAVSQPATPLDVPVTLAVQPTIIRIGQSAVLNFAYANAASASVRMVAVSDSSSCSTAAAAYSAAPTNAVTVASANSLSWTLPSQSTSGRYRVCTWTSTSQTWTVSSVVFVYGGNPAFFVMNPLAQDSNGRSAQGTQNFQVRFVGTNLSAAADSMRFLSVNGGQCSASAVNDASVSIKTVTTGLNGEVVAQVSIVGGNNLFRVCYYTNAMGTWFEVPDFDTLPRDVIRNVTGAAGTLPPWANVNGTTSSPTTTTAATATTTCASAPVIANFTAITTNNVVVLTVSGSTMPSSFDVSIADLLCLSDASDVSIVRFEPGTSSSKVYIQINCPTTDSSCNSAERLAALVQYASALRSVKSATTVSFSGLAAATSSEGGHDGPPNGLVIGLAVGISVVTILLAVTVGVLVYRHRRSNRLATASAVAYDEDDVEIVQGNVIGIAGEPIEDNSPIPPPPEKPTKSVPMYAPTTPTHPSEVRDEE